MEKKEDADIPFITIGKFQGQVKQLFALTLAEVILGSRLLQIFLPEYAYVYIVYSVISLLFSKINIRIKRIRNDVVFVNLAGMVMPVIIALYFLLEALKRFDLLIVLASIIVTFLIANKFKRQSGEGQEARTLFAVVPPVLVAFFAPFILLQNDNLLMVRMIFAFAIATLAAAGSDIYGVKIEHEGAGTMAHFLGGNGIVDGVWFAGFSASIGVLVFSV